VEDVNQAVADEIEKDVIKQQEAGREEVRLREQFQEQIKMDDSCHFPRTVSQNAQT
jgi:hypothetical protein